MAAGLDPLGDHRVHPGRGGGLGFGHRANLEQDLDPTRVGYGDIGGRVAPEQHHRRHSGVGGRSNLGGQQGFPVRFAGLADDQVETEGSVGQFPGARHQRGDGVGGQAVGAEHPEAAGARDGRDQLGAGAAEPGRPDRIVNPELAAQAGTQSAHQPIVAHSERSGNVPLVGPDGRSGIRPCP
jgi:hypothetical protein